MTPDLAQAAADRQAAEDALEDGWAGTILVEHLTALAGGLLGGTLVTALAWHLTWKAATRRHALTLDRRLRRRLAHPYR